jgi:hypothetical protein
VIPTPWIAALRSSHRPSVRAGRAPRARVRSGTLHGQRLEHRPGPLASGEPGRDLRAILDAALGERRAAGADSVSTRLGCKWNALSPVDQVVRQPGGQRGLSWPGGDVSDSAARGLRVRHVRMDLDAGRLPADAAERTRRAHVGRGRLPRSDGTVAPDAVDLLIDTLPEMAVGWEGAGRTPAGPGRHLDPARDLSPRGRRGGPASNQGTGSRPTAFCGYRPRHSSGWSTDGSATDRHPSIELDGDGRPSTPARRLSRILNTPARRRRHVQGCHAVPVGRVRVGHVGESCD